MTALQRLRTAVQQLMKTTNGRQRVLANVSHEDPPIHAIVYCYFAMAFCNRPQSGRSCRRIALEFISCAAV